MERRESDFQVTSTKSIPGGMEQEKSKQLRNIPEVLEAGLWYRDVQLLQKYKIFNILFLCDKKNFTFVARSF